MPTVAIVGRPNVGKSAIFNRLVGRSIAIVHDEPGVTRDRIAAPCAVTTHTCTIVDTGGIGLQLDDGFTPQVTTEADIAMETADLILFVVDARDGLIAIDQDLAQKLRSAKPPVHLILNKADNPEQEEVNSDFARLGFGDGLAISAAHGKGFGQLAELIDAHLEPLVKEAEEIQEEVEKDGLKITIVGRPNVGKSSLVNAILKDERTIVSDVAGTTRDALDIPYVRGGEKHTLIDTAGLRQRSKMDTSVEVFSAMRTERSIRRADICLLVIDASIGVTSMDRKIAKHIQQENKPCLIVFNKFDLYHPDANKSARLEEATAHIYKELFFLSYAPFACTSALKGSQLDMIFKQLLKIRTQAQDVMGTGVLNRVLQEAMVRKPPSEHKKYGRRLKMLYATAAINDRYTTIPVPTYILFVNDKRLMHEHYEQYLSNRLREKVNTPGIPIIFSVRSRNRGSSKKG